MLFTMIQGTVLYAEIGVWMIHGDTFCVGNRPRLESLDVLCGPGCASPKFGLAAVVTLGNPAAIPGPHGDISLFALQLFQVQVSVRAH